MTEIRETYRTQEGRRFLRSTTIGAMIAPEVSSILLYGCTGQGPRDWDNLQTPLSGRISTRWLARRPTVGLLRALVMDLNGFAVFHRCNDHGLFTGIIDENGFIDHMKGSG